MTGMLAGPASNHVLIFEDFFSLMGEGGADGVFCYY